MTLCGNLNLLPISNVSCVVVLPRPCQSLSLDTNGCTDGGITDPSLAQSGSSPMFVFLVNLLLLLYLLLSFSLYRFLSAEENTEAKR